MEEKNFIEIETQTITAHSSSLESFKKLRTNLMYTENLKVISLTSSIPDEGKTVIAFNLAYAFAQTGKKVCLVDCDLRRTSLKEYLMLTKHHDGVSELLTNQGKDGLNSTNIDNLYIMLAGKTPPNPSEILSSSRFTDLIETLRKHFDYVIIDTPPLAAGSDATVVSRAVDGTVFVLRNEFTSKKIAKRAIGELTKNGGRVVGVVLSRVKASSQDYGRYGYYGYYGYY
jgi:capsular exopolysaccharide synthesis family protein